MQVRGVRGAITIKEDTEIAVLQETDRLLREMIKANKIDPEQVASVFISVTDDITNAFPARAMRAIDGWSYVPVMCMKEMAVPHALQKCIRVMMHINTTKRQREIEHIYLEEAVTLRPDLVQHRNNQD
ncbi:chorismate mutase [Niallia sp. XMNu-256]|uniref:chorismate mutase n=1 Tax=Niallia sp. XMNu-256 TaxID=3082444 RepID=UPI0030D58F9E